MLKGVRTVKFQLLKSNFLELHEIRDASWKKTTLEEAEEEAVRHFTLGTRSDWDVHEGLRANRGLSGSSGESSGNELQTTISPESKLRYRSTSMKKYVPSPCVRPGTFRPLVVVSFST